MGDSKQPDAPTVADTSLQLKDDTLPASKAPAPQTPQSNVPPPIHMTDPMMEKIFENCFVKAGVSGILRAGLGFAFGSFFTMGFNPAIEEIQSKTVLGQVMEGFKMAGRNGWSMAKGFGAAGTVFAGTECLIEQYRGKTDMYNSVSAGCLSGAALAARGGAQAMGIGCAGFAAFSLAIDYFTGRHDSSSTIKHDNDRFS